MQAVPARASDRPSRVNGILIGVPLWWCSDRRKTRPAAFALLVECGDPRADHFHFDRRVGGAREGQSLVVSLARCMAITALEVDVPKNAQRLRMAEGVARGRVEFECRARQLH